MHTEIVKALRSWGTGESLPMDPSCGICGNLWVFAVDGYQMVEDIVEYWPKYSGRPATPILNYGREKYTQTLWKNPLRLELCLFLADYTEKNPKIIEKYLLTN